MWTGFDQLFFFQNTPRKSCLLSLQQQRSTGSSAGRTLGQRTLEVSAIFTQPGLTKWLMNDTPMSQVTLHGITRHSLLFVYQLMRSALSFCRVIFVMSSKEKMSDDVAWRESPHMKHVGLVDGSNKRMHPGDQITLTYIDTLRTSM